MWQRRSAPQRRVPSRGMALVDAAAAAPAAPVQRASRLSRSASRSLPRAFLVAATFASIAAASDVTRSVRSMRKTLNDGTVMPMVGLGTWKSKASDVGDAVYFAICEAGYRHIDAAQIYMNQEQVGSALRRAQQNCGVSREDLWVTSKVWMTDYHPRDIPAAVDRILRELGLDYIDQVLLHWPVAYGKPPAGCPPDCPERFAGTDDPMRPRGRDGLIVNDDIPLSDTWQALEEQKAAGKVRSIGVSNFNAEEIRAMVAGRRGAILPAVNQVETHIGWHQPSLRAAMRDLGITVVAYTPLGNPAVYDSSGRAEGMSSKLVTDMADEAGLTPAQVMLNFLLAQDVVVIPKSTTPSRIRSNLDFDARLSPAQLARLAEGTPQRRLANPRNRPGGRHVFDDGAPPQRPEL